MHESFYGFAAKPFQLACDPRLYFDGRPHRRAMAFLDYGLRQGEGFVAVTGEVGTGKTMVVRNFLAHLDPGSVAAAHLVSTQLDAEDLLRMVTAAFGGRARELSKSELLVSLESLLLSHAGEGRKCLLVVDEAQNLTARALEELRLLSNFQAGGHSPLLIFLVAQPGFRGLLQTPLLQPLRQRVIAACHIEPLDAADTRGYVEHRLERAAGKDAPVFTQDAFEAIFAASGGVPRCINLLCDRALLAGFLANQRRIGADLVSAAAEEIAGETLAPAAMMRRLSDRGNRR